MVNSCIRIRGLRFVDDRRHPRGPLSTRLHQQRYKMTLRFLIFLSCFYFANVFSQNISFSTPVVQTTVGVVNKIVSDPSTGGYYASAGPNAVIKFDRNFAKLWEKTWTGASYTYSVATHSTGDSITCSYSYGSINGVGTVTQATWTQYAVMRVRSDSVITHTVMYGAGNYDVCYDMAMGHDLQGSYYYLTGFKKGNFITSSASGGCDAMLLKYNFADSSVIWSYATTSLFGNWDEGMVVAEISSTRVQMFAILWGANSQLITLDASNGAYVNNYALPFSDSVYRFFDRSSGWWWFLTASKIVYAIDTAGVTRLTLTLQSPLTPVVLAVHFSSYNIFVGYKDTVDLTVTQIGLLSGTTISRRWTPAVSTDTFGAATVIGNNLIVGGNAFARMFPNAIFNDTCQNRTVLNGMSCRPCDRGDYFANGRCIKCPFGAFCSNGTLNVCPLNSNTSSIGSSNSSACLCNAGYQPVNGSCQLCPIGNFCPGGSRSIVCGPNKSTRSLGSVLESQCICNPSFNLESNGTCVLCPAGSFCNNGTRTTCPQNSRSSIGSFSLSNCSCNAGYFESKMNECAICPFGAFCINGTLNVCPLNSNTSSTGSSNSSTCLCNAGYQPVNGSCQLCPIGNFCPGGSRSIVCGPNKSTRSLGSVFESQCICNPSFNLESNGTCVLCPAGSFCNNGTRTTCPQNSRSSIGSFLLSNCSCDSGYFGSHGACHICPRGSHCRGGLHATPCGPNSNTTLTASKNVSECVCNAGFFGFDGKCQVCPSGNFCPGGRTVEKCPAHTNSKEQSSSVHDCICIAGYFGKSTSCQVCPVGSFCPGGALTISCGEGSTTDTVGSSSRSQCKCRAGYFGSNDQCFLCPFANFCPDGETIVPCTPNSNTSSTGSAELEKCQCNPGYYKMNGECVSCPFGFFCPGSDEIISCGSNRNTTNLGSIGSEQCQCDPGYFGGDSCSICPSGSYCPGGSLKIECGPRSFTVSDGSTDQSSCKCEDGFFMVNNECRACTEENGCKTAKTDNFFQLIVTDPLWSGVFFGSTSLFLVIIVVLCIVYWRKIRSKRFSDTSMYSAQAETTQSSVFTSRYPTSTLSTETRITSRTDIYQTRSGSPKQSQKVLSVGNLVQSRFTSGERISRYPSNRTLSRYSPDHSRNVRPASASAHTKSPHRPSRK